LERLPVAKAPIILVINASDIDAEKNILSMVDEFVKHSAVKSRNLTSSTLDLTIECRTDKGGDLIRALMDLEGVTSASLLSHDGEVTF
jgi:hypothetical protein